MSRVLEAHQKHMRDVVARLRTVVGSECEASPEWSAFMLDIDELLNDHRRLREAAEETGSF